MHYHRVARNRRAATPFGKGQPCSGRRDNVSGCITSRKQRSRPAQLDFIPFLGVDTQKWATSTHTSRRRALVDHRGSLSSPSSNPAPTIQKGDPPQQLRSRNTGNNEPSCLPSFGHGQSPKTPACKSTVTNCDLDFSPTNITSSCISSMSYIHHFLQDCSPPLDHLLSRFVDLGFQTQDILREVAHVWTSEERRELMGRLAPGPNGNKLTELELAALERGFQALRSTYCTVTLH